MTIPHNGLGSLSFLNVKLKQPLIPALNGLRALAVTLVFLDHAKLTKQTGVIGVEAFFVLSGFLITWKLLEEWDLRGTLHLRQFYFRRTLRIFPAFYVFWLVSVSQNLIRNGFVPWGDAFAAAFYISNYYHGLRSSTQPYMLHTWSLSVEEQFYLLWPTLFTSFGNQLRRLTVLLCGLVACVWTYRAAFSVVGSSRTNWYIFTAFEMRVDQLAIGCLLAILIHGQRFGRFWDRICNNIYLPFLTLLLLTCSQRLVGNVQSRNALAFIFDPILFSIFLVQVIWFSDKRPWSWLNHPLLNWIGKLSYSIYLYHELALAVSARLTEHASEFRAVVSVLLTLIMASTSYYCVEKPFLRLKRSVST